MRERYEVFDGLPTWVARGPELEVLEAVVLLVAVAMVDCFVGEEFAAEVLLHDVTVFEDVPSISAMSSISARISPPRTTLGNLDGRRITMLLPALVVALTKPPRGGESLTTFDRTHRPLRPDITPFAACLLIVTTA